MKRVQFNVARSFNTQRARVIVVAEGGEFLARRRDSDDQISTTEWTVPSETVVDLVKERDVGGFVNTGVLEKVVRRTRMREGRTDLHLRVFQQQQESRRVDRHGFDTHETRACFHITRRTRACQNPAKMKRSNETELGREVLIKFREDPLVEAVRAACCVEKDGTTTLSCTPIILLGLSEDADIDRLAYWPANEEVGLRVLKKLDEAVGECEGDLYEHNNIRLMDSLWAQVEGRENKESHAFLCKHFQVKKVAELGVFRVVEEDGVLLTDLSPHLYTRIYHRYC
jgi:hypothetical protein